MSIPPVLVVAPDREAIAEFDAALTGQGVDLLSTSSPHEALDWLRERAMSVILVPNDLHGVDGVEWLVDARTLDPEVALVLVVGAETPAQVVADAVNYAGVCKVISRPLTTAAFTEDLRDAIRTYTHGVAQSRTHALRAVRMRRLGDAYDRMQRDIDRQYREIRRLRHHLATARSGPSSRPLDDEVARLSLPGADLEAMATLATAPLGAIAPDLAAHGDRVSRLAHASALALGWPAETCAVVRVAAMLHHIFTPRFPDEYLVELRNSSARHAELASTYAGAVPGLEGAAAIIGAHHLQVARETSRAPELEAARLLQVTSLFDELLYDPRGLAHRDPTLSTEQRLTYATNVCLEIAPDRLDVDLTTMLLTQVVPAFLHRDERAIAPAEVDEGMILSRSLLGGGSLVYRSGSLVTREHVTEIRRLAEHHELRYVWIEGPGDSDDQESAAVA